jgi:MscS family membrane protein
MTRALQWLLLACLWLASPAWAETEPVPEAVPAVPETLGSPRATMGTFLQAMNDIKRGDPGQIDTALSTLDLSEVNPLVRQERGTDLAWMLLEVMDRTRLVVLQEVPDAPAGSSWLFQQYHRGAVHISRQSDGRWLFDSRTLARLPDIVEEVSNLRRVVGEGEESEYVPLHLRLRRELPQTLTQRGFLLENWRWLALLVTVALGVLVDKLVGLLSRQGLTHWSRRSRSRAIQEIPDNMLRPFGLMAMALVWWLGINLMGLPEQALLVLLVAVKFLASAATVWAAYRLVDLLSARLREHAEATENTLDDILVPLIPRTLKIFIAVVGIVFVANNLNIDVTGLVAGLGLGGLAFALAAKDMVQNLFGSITVLLDRTFTVGDWIVVDGKEGTVEQIGFRSTRIRTFYNSLITLPNSHFITAEVDNMGKRRYRRLSTKFGLAYHTPPERIEAFCEGVRELVRQHPYMRKDYYHVYLNGLGDSSLEVLVYVFWETPDWSTELRERHRFLLDCLRLAKQLEIEYAFPTQTLYLRQEDAESGGRPPALSEAAETGRETARAIVRDTTGLGVKPPPVRIR